ncbi:unnamed protein product, partial [Rotaria sp. Silwood1]
DQSTQLKKQREEKLKLLYSIDEFKFFDILDESDEILRHGKELNYTLGSAKPLDGGSMRWEIPFLIFKFIFCDQKFREILKSSSQSDDCPVVFQENFRPVTGIGGGCPLVRFIKHEYFIKNIKRNLSREFMKAWLSHELLYHVMSYRYRVEYGLSEKKGKEIAIPFRGKDLPSENSEFSHPDIMIGFTILSYLYRGLDLIQVKHGLMRLKSDRKQDKDSLLQKWVQENRNWINEQNQRENEEFPEWLTSFRTLDLENEDKIV